METRSQTVQATIDLEHGTVKNVVPINDAPKFKVLTPGHKYVLQNFENTLQGQTIQFIEKAADSNGVFVTVNDGTTNEAVLEALIDRMRILNTKVPDRNTSIAITHLEDALLRLELRTKERRLRGVKGTPNK